MVELTTLLMSDLVDSTATTQRLGESAAKALWTTHDRLARALLNTWRGVEIDKSDGFLLLFENAFDAAGFALAYHRELMRLPEPVRARVGMHVARIELRSNDAEDVARGAKAREVESWLDKATVSRVMSLAQGGQTLLTASAALVLAGSALRLQPYGHWRLKGIAEPMEVFEVGDDRTAFVSPSDTEKAWRVVGRDGMWLPLRDVRHSLPAARDAFIGREQTLHELAQQFRAGSKLVSLHGMGGIGKTRSALRFAWSCLGDFPGGVWFCDLSSAQGLDGLLYAAAQGLGLTLESKDPVGQIGRVLATRGSCMVVLDNFEQVVSLAESTLGLWMGLAPEARFLVTTRELLGITGEQAFTLSSLSKGEAASLFRARAAEVAGARGADVAADESMVERLVTLLDGLPLAIELAAARTRIMSVHTLLDRMGERFRLLAAPGRPIKRHSTLRATLDWSWEHLTDPDRCALAQLSVFEGGFSLEDAEAVLDLQDSDTRAWIPDALQSLVEKSMVRTSGGDRFDLLRSVQEYAAEHLVTAGRLNGSGPAMQRAARQRHWRHFGAFDERVAVTDDSASVDNLATACRRATDAADASSAAGALGGLWAVLRRTGPFRSVLELGQRVLDLATLDVATRGKVERVLGSANELIGDIGAARASFDSALLCARASGDRVGEGWSLWALGEHLYKRGQSDASGRHLQQALQIAAEHQQLLLQCAALNALGTLEMRMGNGNAARAAYEAALTLARRLRDEGRVGGLLGNLAILAHDAGAEEEAMSLYQQALALSVQVHDRRWEGNTRCNLGLLYQDRGRRIEGEQQFRAALAIAQETGHAMLEATALCNLGILLDASGDAAQACRHFEQAVSVAVRTGDRRAEGQFSGYLGEALARCGKLEPAFELLALAEAALREAGDEASLALLMCQRAIAEHLAGRTDEAALTFGRVRPPPGTAASSEWRSTFERAESLLGAR